MRGDVSPDGIQRGGITASGYRLRHLGPKKVGMVASRRTTLPWKRVFESLFLWNPQNICTTSNSEPLQLNSSLVHKQSLVQASKESEISATAGKGWRRRIRLTILYVNRDPLHIFQRVLTVLKVCFRLCSSVSLCTDMLRAFSNFHLFK